MSKSKKTGSPARILAKALSHSNVPLYLLDQHSHIAFANAAMAEWSGVPLDRLLHLSCKSPLPDDSADLRNLASILAVPRSSLACTRPIAPPNPKLSSDPASPSSQFLVLSIPLTEQETGWSIQLILPSGSKGVSRKGSPQGLPDPSLHAIDLANQIGIVGDIAVETKEILELRQKAYSAISLIRNQYAELDGLDAVLGNSPFAKRTLAQIQMAISSDASVCIAGPPGSGSQDVAKAIFAGRMKRLEPSARTQLFPVDCRLMDSSLLANVFEMMENASGRGSVAVHQALLLESIELLPVEAHTALVRFLNQSRSPTVYTTTSAGNLSTCHDGNPTWRSITAKLDIARIEVAALRDRAEDIPLLIEVALQRLQKIKPRTKVVKVSPQALSYLQTYSWPGNSKELFQAMSEAYDSCESMIEVVHLPLVIRTFPSFVESQSKDVESLDLDRMLESIERSLIGKAIELHSNNRAMAARYLGISRTRLLRRLDQLNITPPVPLSKDKIDSENPTTDQETPAVFDQEVEVSSKEPNAEIEELIEFIEIDENANAHGSESPSKSASKKRKSE